MCVWAPVSYDKHDSFSHLFISALWKKTDWNKPRKGCLSPSSQHLAGLNESISLRSLVACHFGWIQLNTHYQLVVGRNERFRELLLQAWVTAPKSSFWISAVKSNNHRAKGRFVLASGFEQASPSRHDNCHHGRSICGLTPTVLHEQKNRPPVFIGAERSFSVIMAHFSAEISGNRCERKMSRPPFISARCLWCLGYIRAPADLTPGLTEGRAAIHLP